ncbi:Bax inhibitor-1/YccA family protein [Nocardioides marmoraquaticus]
MQSNNPAFTRAEGFNGRGSTVSDPSTWRTGAPGQSYGQSYGYDSSPAYGQGGHDPYGAGSGTVDQGRMTIDSVVQKTAITIGTVFVVAAATWFLTGDVSTENLPLLGTLSLVGSLGGFALAMVNSFKKVVSPPLVLAYAALQGVFIGAFSKVVEAQFVQSGESSLVLQAVLGTFAAAAGTLAAYKFFDIKVTDRMRRIGMGLALGLMGVLLLNLVLSFFGADFGVAGFGTMGLIFSVIGLAAGVFFLILDFDFVEQGVAAGLPERESWRAAFGLTVTLIWIYINLLRLLAILRGQD